MLSAKATRIHFSHMLQKQTMIRNNKSKGWYCINLLILQNYGFVSGCIVVVSYSLMGRRLCSVLPPFDQTEGSANSQQVLTCFFLYQLLRPTEKKTSLKHFLYPFVFEFRIFSFVLSGKQIESPTARHKSSTQKILENRPTTDGPSLHRLYLYIRSIFDIYIIQRSSLNFFHLWSIFSENSIKNEPLRKTIKSLGSLLFALEFYCGCPDYGTLMS